MQESYGTCLVCLRGVSVCYTFSVNMVHFYTPSKVYACILYMFLLGFSRTFHMRKLSRQNSNNMLMTICTYQGHFLPILSSMHVSMF